MKLLPYPFRLIFIPLLVAFCGFAATALAESAELAQARAQLLELYTRKQDDGSPAVKNLKLEIARLEYLDAHLPAPATDSTRLISVSFPGGPFSALVAATEKASPGAFNVVGEKADFATELPPFSVRNADAASLANALSAMLQPRGYVLTSNGRSLDQTSVFTLRKLTSSEIVNFGERASAFQSFQLASYLEFQSVDDIVGAIRAAWELDPKHAAGALQLKFHPPTGILLVSGPSEAQNIVLTVLRELRRSSDQSPRQNQKAAPPPPASDKK